VILVCGGVMSSTGKTTMAVNRGIERHKGFGVLGGYLACKIHEGWRA